MTQTNMLSTAQNQEPRRRQSVTGQKRNSPSPKRYGFRIPSKRQTSPTFQRRVSVTVQTQTSPKLHRLNSDRHHSPTLHRRVSTSPKRWGSRATAKDHNAPTAHRRASPNSRRAASPSSRKRRTPSPSRESNPVVSQRRESATQSYANVRATNQSSRSKVSEDDMPAAKLSQPSFRKGQNPNAITQPPLAPPLPPRTNKNNLYKKQSSSHRNKETESNIKSSLHEELRDRFRRPRSFKSQRVRGVQKTKEILFIDKDSTAEDVSEWLKIKGFSDLVQETYKGYTGSDMFQLSLAEMEDDLEHEEAIRLDGQLTLQKNSSGYATRSAQELNEILRRRKQDLEPDEDV